MNEPQQVPIEVRMEGLQIELDRANAQLTESLVLIQQLMMANHTLDKNARALAAGLVEIQNIKGKPPIQVARTIATRTIDGVISEMNKTVEQHEQESKATPANNNSILCGSQYVEGTPKHETGNIPSHTHRPGTVGEQGAGL